MISIPTDTNLSFWQQITTLDGTDFQLEFRYNQREDVYYLSISLTDGTALATGIKLVSNYRLLQAYSSSLMPPGELIAVASGADDSPAGLGELGLGQRVELTYYTQAEMVAAGKDLWRYPGFPST